MWNLTGGAQFATDTSNASRMQVFNTETLEWDAGLGALFAAPLTVLPQVRASDNRFGTTAATTALPVGVPIHAMMGDSHAALYGHGVRTPGMVKATYGTGSSLLTLTNGRRLSLHGLSGTVAWRTDEQTSHALKGSITVSTPDRDAVRAQWRRAVAARGFRPIPALPRHLDRSIRNPAIQHFQHFFGKPGIVDMDVDHRQLNRVGHHLPHFVIQRRHRRLVAQR